MWPSAIVLPGREIMGRTRNLINGMVNARVNMGEFGEVVVSIMQLPPERRRSMAAELMQGYLKQFRLPSTLGEDDDSSFDQRIIIEALMYTAGCFSEDWVNLGLDVSLDVYTFGRWVGMDMVLIAR